MNNYYVGKAPQVGETVNNATQKISSSYTPTQVSPNMSFAQGLENISNTMNKISEHIKSINDYNDITDFSTELENMRLEAITNKYTPDEYNKQFNNLINSYKFNDAETKAKAMRLAEAERISTLTKLTDIHTKLLINSSLASLDNYINTVKQGLTGEDDYNLGVIKINNRINSLVDKKILDPLAAQKMKDSVKQDLYKTLVTEKMLANPNKFLQDVKAGKYDSVFSDNAQKQLVIKSVKSQILHNERIALEQEQIQIAQQSKDIFQDVMNGKVNITQVLADNNIGAQVKTNVLKQYNTFYNNNTETVNNMWNVIDKIHNGGYASLQDLQTDIFSKKFTNQQLNYIYRVYESFETLSKNSGSTNKNILSSPIIKNSYNTFIPGHIKTIINWINNSDIMGSNKILYDEKDLTARARQLFLDNMNDCLKTNNESECIGNAMNIANESVIQVMQPVEKDSYIKYNQLYFNNIKYDDGSTMGFNINRYKSVPSSIQNQIVNAIYDNIVNNDKLNPTHSFRLDNIISITNGQSVRLKFNLSKEFKDKYKIGFVRAYISISKDGKLIIKPLDSDKRLWSVILNGK